MNLLSVEEALRRVLSDVGPVGSEADSPCYGARPCAGGASTALRTQPPFDASAMDGYAVRAADVEHGHRPDGDRRSRRRPRLCRAWSAPGEAVRIFTGAPVPDGADAVLMQEHARREGDRVTSQAASGPAQNIRRTGLDFRSGRRRARRAAAARPARPRSCRRQPTIRSLRGAPPAAVVAILATGDEIVMPGGRDRPEPDRRLEQFRPRRDGRGRGRDASSTSASRATIWPALEAAIGRARDAGRRRPRHHRRRFGRRS